MKLDLKFGLHVIWIVPVLCIFIVYDAIFDQVDKITYKRKLNKTLKSNSDIKELSDLSGIK